MTKRYALKGINSDTDTCDVCGRTELQKVIWLAEIDMDGNEFSEPFAAGSTCGSTMLKLKNAGKFNTAIKTAARKMEQKKTWFITNHSSSIEASKIQKAFRSDNGPSEWRQSNEYKIATQLRQEAKEAASIQVFSVEL